MKKNIQWIQIEPTTCCNMKCIYCDRTISNLQGQHIEQTIMEAFIEGIKSLPSLKSILIQGFGEPFLFPKLEQLVTSIYQYRPDISIQLVTNGMINSTGLLLKYIDVLYVSFDSICESYWNNIRIGGNPEKILRNVNQFNKDNENIKVILNMVLTSENEDQVLDIIKIANINMFYGIQIIPLFNIDNKIKEISCWDQTKEKIRQYAKLYPKLNIFMPDSEGCTINCMWNEQGLYIMFTGEVTPCCVQSSNEGNIFGNLRQMSLVEIISTKECEDFDSRKSIYCKECRDIKFYQIWNTKYPLPLIK